MERGAPLGNAHQREARGVMVVLHVTRGEQDACIAQQHVSGRVRPAGSPLTSPPDPGQTRRTRRTAGPVRRGRRQPGPGSAQEPARPPLREACPLGDAVPHASRSCRMYTSTGWRGKRALPGAGPPCCWARSAARRRPEVHRRPCLLTVGPVGTPAVHVGLEFAPPAGVAGGDLWGWEPVRGTGMGISTPMRRAIGGPTRVYR
jgi:hypothetical protein